MTKKEYLKKSEGYGEACLDCGGLNHAYMVKNSIWKKLVAPSDRRRCICLVCLENRLGGPLKIFHFSNALINHGFFGFDKYEYCNIKE